MSLLYLPKVMHPPLYPNFAMSPKWEGLSHTPTPCGNSWVSFEYFLKFVFLGFLGDFFGFYGFYFFFGLSFVSQKFMIYRAAGDGGGYFGSPLYHFHLLQLTISGESSPLHIASSWTRTRNARMSNSFQIKSNLFFQKYWVKNV